MELEKTVNSLEGEVSDLKERLRGVAEIIHIMEPILDDFIEFAELPAFQEFKKKKWEEKEARSRVEAEESSNEIKDEIMKKEKGTW